MYSILLFPSYASSTRTAFFFTMVELHTCNVSLFTMSKLLSKIPLPIAFFPSFFFFSAHKRYLV